MVAMDALAVEGTVIVEEVVVGIMEVRKIVE
jgi:hypothetical protein